MSQASSMLSTLIDSPHFLRRVLWLDAASGVATGLLQFGFADALAPLLGLPVQLLLVSSYILGGFVLGIAWIASRKVIPVWAMWLLIGGNTLWVLACLGLLASSLVAPTVFGVSFLITQAVAVGILTELEWMGVRKIQYEAAW